MYTMKNSKEKGEKHVMNHDEEVTGWTELRPVVWLAAVIVAAVGPSWAFFVTIPGAIVYSAACVVIEVVTKAKRAVETFRKDSFIISYLERTFTDIDHINSISGSGGLRFDYAQIDLRPSMSSMEVYTTAEKNRTAFLKQYHDRAVAYHLCKEVKSPEELKEELMPHWLREGAGYSPECPHFFNDLREMNFEEINEGGSTRYGFKMPHFLAVCAAESLEGSAGGVEKTEIARRAIMKCAKEGGYHARCKYLSKDCYKLTIHF